MANYLPFNSINADRAVKAEDWAWYFSTFIGDGVFPKPTDGLQVVASDGMNILIKAGFGFIKGYAFRNPSEFQITVSTADGSLRRIDRVVLRWDLTNRLMELDILQGTPGNSPTAKELTRTADTYELALADISIAAGTTTITQSMITDRRTDTSLCGIVEGTVSQIDWDVLTAQLNAFMSEYSTAIVSDYEDYTNQITEFETDFESDANTWIATKQAAFESWVASMRDILDTETATHLQNEIEKLQQRVGVPDEYDPHERYLKGAFCIYNNQLYRCIKNTVEGSFDDTCWDATTALEEIDKAIAREKDSIFEEMAKGSLRIDSNIVLDSLGNNVLLNTSDTLAVSQSLKLAFN